MINLSAMSVAWASPGAILMVYGWLTWFSTGRIVEAGFASLQLGSSKFPGRRDAICSWLSPFLLFLKIHPKERKMVGGKVDLRQIRRDVMGSGKLPSPDGKLVVTIWERSDRIGLVAGK